MYANFIIIIKRKFLLLDCASHIAFSPSPTLIKNQVVSYNCSKVFFYGFGNVFFYTQPGSFSSSDTLLYRSRPY